MSTMLETVTLPDPDVRPRVHPLDLTPARGPFCASFVAETLGHPTAVLSLGAVLWFVSNNPVTPLLAAAAMMLSGLAASRYFSDEAWAFIPRKRQDRARPLPLAWEWGRSFVLASMLLSALLLGVRYVTQPAFSTGVGAYAAGAGIGVCLLIGFGLLWRAGRAIAGKEEPGAVWLSLPSFAVVIVATIYAYELTWDSQVPGDWTMNGLLVGAGTILGVQIVWWLGQFLLGHRSATMPRQSERETEF